MANERTNNDRTQSAQIKKNSRAEEWLKNAVKDKHVRMIPFSEISKVKYNVAKGGSGTIHLGAWRNMHIAIKEQHNTNDLIKELKMHKQVHDSNYIVKFFGITKHPLTHDTCIVMQFAENGCLQDYLETQNIAISWLTKYRLAWEVSSGLDFIHRENIFHTDLHSRNILIDTHGKALITDFGLSKSVNKTIYTTKAGLFGVVPYVAPERMQNPTYTYNAKCDIYSLGVIFWELSSCVIPFERQLQDVMLAVNIIAGVREKTVPGTAVEYEMLFRRCWDGLPQNRPSMDIVLSELVELLAAEQLNPRPAAPRPISLQPPRPLSSESMVAPSTICPYDNDTTLQSSPENTTPMRPASPPSQRPGAHQSFAQGLGPGGQGVPSVPPVRQDRTGARVSFVGDQPLKDTRANANDAKANNNPANQKFNNNHINNAQAILNGRAGPTPADAQRMGGDASVDQSKIPSTPQLLPPLPAFKALALTTPPNDISIQTPPTNAKNSGLPETASLALANGISMVSVVNKLNLGSLKTISTISPPPPGAPPPPPASSGTNTPRVISPPVGRPKVISPPQMRNNQVVPPPHPHPHPSSGHTSRTISPPVGAQGRLVPPPPPPGTPPPGTPPIKPSPSPSPSLNPTLKPPTGPPPPSPSLTGAPAPPAPASAPGSFKPPTDSPRNPASPIHYVPTTTYSPSASKGKTIQDKKASGSETRKEMERSSSPSPEPRPMVTPPHRQVPMGFPVVTPLDPHMFPKRSPALDQQSPSMLPSPPPSIGSAAGSGMGISNSGQKTSRPIEVKNIQHRANSPDLSRKENHDLGNSRSIELSKPGTENGAIMNNNGNGNNGNSNNGNNRVMNGSSPSLSPSGPHASPRVVAQGFFPVVDTVRAGLSATTTTATTTTTAAAAAAAATTTATAIKPRFQFDNFYSLSDPYKDMNVDVSAEFFTAITQGDTEAIERILKAQPFLIHESIGFWPHPTPILVAARSRHALEAMRVLIKNGAALDRGDHNGTTVLHFVCEQYPNPTEAVIFLTKAGADCNSRDGKKRTPLMVLLQNSHLVSTKVLIETARVLFKFGAQTKVADHQHQRTPLHYAIQHCKEPAPVIELLLKKGADANAMDSRKSTPLHMVLERMDNEEIVQMLLLFGADPGLKNGNKRNALCVAAEYLRVMSAWFLLENDLMSSAPETIKKANELCSKADGPDKNSKPLFKNLLSDWQGKEGKVRRIQLAQDCILRVQRTPDMKTIDQTPVALEFLESAGVPIYMNNDQDMNSTLSNNNNNNNNNSSSNNNNNNNNNTNSNNNNNGGSNNNNSGNNNSVNGGNTNTNNNNNNGATAVNGPYVSPVAGGAGGTPGILKNGLFMANDSTVKNSGMGNGNGNGYHPNGHVQVKELRLAEGVEPLKQTMLPVKSVQQLEKEREAIRNQLLYTNKNNAFGH